MKEIVLSARPTRVSDLDKMLDLACEGGVPSVIRMNARDYADVRAFGRDSLDIECRPNILKTGVQAYYRDCSVVTTKGVPYGDILVLDGSGTELSHFHRSDPDRLGPGYCHLGSREDCLFSRLCLIREVMDT